MKSRQAHPARDPEQRGGRRSGDRRDLHGRHARQRAAAAEAARRHREGAGRGRRAAPRSRDYTRTEDYYEAEAEASPDALGDQVEAEALARSVVSEFENYVKLNKKVSPEVVAAVDADRRPSKLADTIASHLAVKIADKQDDPRDPDGRQAPREGARPDGERDLRAAGREAHPLARQAPDGEDPARVLPQRADEGDPEGARRRGRPATSWPSSRSKIEKTKLTKEARDKAHGAS